MSNKIAPVTYEGGLSHIFVFDIPVRRAQLHIKILSKSRFAIDSEPNQLTAISEAASVHGCLINSSTLVAFVARTPSLFTEKGSLHKESLAIVSSIKRSISVFQQVCSR
jgi:hypothetical protein